MLWIFKPYRRILSVDEVEFTYEKKWKNEKYIGSLQLTRFSLTCKFTLNSDTFFGHWFLIFLEYLNVFFFFEHVRKNVFGNMSTNPLCVLTAAIPSCIFYPLTKEVRVHVRYTYCCSWKATRLLFMCTL